MNCFCTGACRTLGYCPNAQAQALNPYNDLLRRFPELQQAAAPNAVFLPQFSKAVGRTMTAADLGIEKPISPLWRLMADAA